MATTLSFDILTSPQFEKIMKCTSETIENACPLGLHMLNAQRASEKVSHAKSEKLPKQM